MRHPRFTVPALPLTLREKAPRLSIPEASLSAPILPAAGLLRGLQGLAHQRLIDRRSLLLGLAKASFRPCRLSFRLCRLLLYVCTQLLRLRLPFFCFRAQSFRLRLPRFRLRPQPLPLRLQRGGLLLQLLQLSLPLLQILQHGLQLHLGSHQLVL